ncbi:hypothetical protein [Endozoicomonas sp. ALB032]|uniref:hypothetical protein n=1 Tax=Endozoicomonas sp. ALB032 TaxID=3403082 RepID=UPI003BB5E709
MSGTVQKQLAINLGFTLVKSIFILLSFRLADMMLSAQMMGLVLLFRRQGALWSNLAQLGFSQILLKYYVSSDNKEKQSQLWSILLRLLAVVLTGLILACIIFAEQINPWLFPAAPTSVSAVFGLYVAGLALGFLANSSWLSEFRFVEANLIDWYHGSLLFVVCLLIGSKLEIDVFSLLLAGFTIVASLFSLWFFARRMGYQRKLFGYDSWSLEKKICHYGFSRALTAYVDMATLVIGPWFLRDEPAQAAQFIAAYTVLRIAQTLVLPIAQVLVLRANSQLYNKKKEKRRILLMAIIVFILSWFGVALYYQLGDVLIAIWLPSSSTEVMSILDELMPYMPAICMFYGLRNFIDINYSQPWNLLALLFSLLAFLISFYLNDGSVFSSVLEASRSMFLVYYIYSGFFIYKLWR